MKVMVVGSEGIVGRALINSFDTSLKNLSICLIDPKVNKNTDISNMNLEEFEFIFLCLPTPTVGENVHDSKLIAQYLKKLDDYRESHLGLNSTIVINSTTLINYANEPFDKLNIVYNPEFISEANASDDFINTELVVIGGNSINCLKLKRFYEKYTNINHQAQYELVDIETAINFKYLRNLKQAWNVIFWEIAHDVTEGKSRKIRHMMDKLPVGENSIIGHDGYRGFGGMCLPKDVKALTNGTQSELPDETKTLLKALLTYNHNIK